MTDIKALARKKKENEFFEVFSKLMVEWGIDGGVAKGYFMSKDDFDSFAYLVLRAIVKQVQAREGIDTFEDVIVNIDNPEMDGDFRDRIISVLKDAFRGSRKRK